MYFLLPYKGNMGIVIFHILGVLKHMVGLEFRVCSADYGNQSAG